MPSFEEQLHSYTSEFPDDFVSLIPALTEHYALLKKWNQVSGLVSPHTIESAASKHYYDSLKIAYFCREHAGERLIVDLGSGGGFPGFIIAFVRTSPIQAYERIQKKRSFLDFCRSHFGFSHFESRGELIQALNEPILLTARAVSPLEELIPFLEGVVNRGDLCAIPGIRSISAAPPGFRLANELVYELPTEGESRVVTLLEKS